MATDVPGPMTPPLALAIVPFVREPEPEVGVQNAKKPFKQNPHTHMFPKPKPQNILSEGQIALVQKTRVRDV